MEGGREVLLNEERYAVGNATNGAGIAGLNGDSSSIHGDPSQLLYLGPIDFAATKTGAVHDAHEVGDRGQLTTDGEEHEAVGPEQEAAIAGDDKADIGEGEADVERNRLVTGQTEPDKGETAGHG